MDEPDMGPNTESGATTDEALTTAQWAEARRAEARGHLPEPEEHFATPSWMDRGEVTPVPRVAPLVPPQAQPAHDNLHAYAPTRPAAPIPESAHWVEHRRPRLVIGTLLTLSLLGAVACLVLAVITQATGAIVGLVGCGFLAVLFRATLLSQGVRTTDLKGSTLRVRTGGDLQIFKLDDPDHIIEVVGEPGSPGWKVVLEAPDGRIVELTAAHVNPAEMHPIAQHFHTVAETERDRRHYRFNL